MELKAGYLFTFPLTLTGLRIRSMELKAFLGLTRIAGPQPGIRSMELKVAYIKVLEHAPFLLRESVQWN